MSYDESLIPTGIDFQRTPEGHLVVTYVENIFKKDSQNFLGRLDNIFVTAYLTLHDETGRYIPSPYNPGPTPTGGLCMFTGLSWRYKNGMRDAVLCKFVVDDKEHVTAIVPQYPEQIAATYEPFILSAELSKVRHFQSNSTNEEIL